MHSGYDAQSLMQAMLFENDCSYFKNSFDTIRFYIGKIVMGMSSEVRKDLKCISFIGKFY